MKPRNHLQLDVYKLSMDFVESIYLLSKSFPKEEKYGLTLQLRRAAISIPSNISEGASRKSKKEFIRFLYIALGSVSEVDTQLNLAERLKFIAKNGLIKNDIMRIKRMLLGLINSIELRIV